MANPWTYSSLINLEYYLEKDAAQALAADSRQRGKRRQSERELYLSCCQGANNQPEAVVCLQRWLAERMAEDGDSMNPGQLFTTILATVTLAVTITGGIAGMLAAAGILSYGGSQPVNVFVYLSCFVGLQLLFLLFFLLLRNPWTRRCASTSLPLTSSLLARMTSQLLEKTIRQAGRLQTAEERRAAARILGLIQSKNRIYSQLFWWPAQRLSQLFSLLFHGGALLATLFLVLTRDIAFGWQSTVQVSATAIHGFVRWMALPWSWILHSGTGWPDLAQIEGSRIVLKDSIASLQTTHLTAWWPFLCLAVLCYAVAPRLVLLLVTRRMEQKALARINPDHALAAALLQRMRTPQLRTEAPADQSSPRPEAVMEKAVRQPAPSAAPVQEATPPARDEPASPVLVQDAIFAQCEGPLYEQFIASLSSAGRLEKHRFDVDGDDDTALLARLGEKSWGRGEEVILIIEAWMPPINDTLTFFRSLRQVLGDHVQIIIGLIGKPGATIFTPPAESDATVWRDKLQSLGDPWLRIEEYDGR